MTKEKEKVNTVNTNELDTLRKLNQSAAKKYSQSMLRSELMRRKLKVIDSMKVINFIDPSLTHLSRASKAYAKWLEYSEVLSIEKKKEALKKVPIEKLDMYKNYATGIEIRTRLRFADKSIEYQNMKVGVEINKWFHKFMSKDKE